MKIKSKFGILVISLAAASSIIISCSKPATTPKPAPAAPLTSLTVNVHDASGIHSVPTPNPKMQLFKTDNDRANKTNPASNLRTGDANGNITFDSLDAINYYYNAYNTSMTLSNATTGNQTTPLTSGVVNTRTAVVR